MGDGETKTASVFINIVSCSYFHFICNPIPARAEARRPRRPHDSCLADFIIFRGQEELGVCGEERIL